MRVFNPPCGMLNCRVSKGVVLVSGASRRRFQLVLIKPSHYDDDGYVIRWWRAMIPSNSLAARVRHRGRLRRAAGARAGRRDRHRRDRRDQYPRRRAGAARALSPPRQFRACRARRRSVEPVSPRARYRAAVPRGRHPGRHRRLSRVGLPVDAGRACGRSRRLPRHGRLHVRRRGRGPASTRCCATRPMAGSRRSTIS